MTLDDKPNGLAFVGELEDAAPEAKNAFLAKVAFELTIRGRDTYEPGTSGVSEPNRLRALNEVMHRLTKRMFKRISGNDDLNETEFWKALTEISDCGGCLADLVASAEAASPLIKSK
ncbi:hypothetical protein [Bryobacter aggregatus]|uniref:hypothetical protein n=1 Tax=Bryobacter aggregatus TaxID=360054 RepID=UPI0004E154EE|nr:hypothetical protein [Bryobacter aggregatus]